MEAKSYTYDGDDWGDYDDDDQYGVEESQSLVPPKPIGFQQKGQTLGSSPASSHSSGHVGLNRSDSYQRGDERQMYLSEPHAPQATAGRTSPLSTSTHSSQHQSTNHQSQPFDSNPDAPRSRTESPARAGLSNPRHASNRVSEQSARSDESNTVDYRNRRNFSPSAVPHSLNTRSVNPSDVDEGSSITYPARKSSLVAEEVPIGQERRSDSSSTAPNLAGNDSKPTATTAFIRPADIYKRMQAEREKERKSLDSQERSTDGSPKPALDRRTSPVRSNPEQYEDLGDVRDDDKLFKTDSFNRRQELSPVSEGTDGHNPLGASSMGLVSSMDPSQNRSRQPAENHDRNTVSSLQSAGSSSRASFLPKVNRISGFGDDLWTSADSDRPAEVDEKHESNEVSSAEAGDALAVEEGSSLEHKSSLGYRSVVKQAFDTPDRSALKTPQSIQDSLGSHGVSRSNTDSTAGISPILSHMSSGTTAAKTRANEAELKVNATSSTNTGPFDKKSSIHLPASALGQRIPRKPASRTASGEQISGMLASNNNLNESLGNTSRVVAHVPEIEQSQNSQHSAAAEMDKSVLTSDNPNDIPGRGRTDSQTQVTPNAEQTNRKSFLATRKPDLSVDSSRAAETSFTRAESPTKGRVRDLAGRFDEIGANRDSSPTSSRASMISLGKSKFDPSLSPGGQRNSIIGEYSTSDQLTAKKVNAQPDSSIRPNIPGGWESFTTAAESPTALGTNSNKGGYFGKDITESQKVPEPSPLAQASTGNVTPVDLTPKKKKDYTSTEDETDPSMVHMASVSQAGKAIGDDILASMGSGRDLEDENSEEQSHQGKESSVPPSGRDKDASSSDRMKKTDSWTGSSAVPSPLPKDSPLPQMEDSQYFRAPAPLSVAGAQRSSPSPNTYFRRNEVTSINDQDSDRLREEIEQTLSPSKSSEGLDDDKALGRKSPPLSSPVRDSEYRESTIIPSEYDSYWASGDDQAQGSSLTAVTEPTMPQNNEKENVNVSGSQDSPKVSRSAADDMRPQLSTRFSWETDVTNNTKPNTADEGSQEQAEVIDSTMDTKTTQEPQIVAAGTNLSPTFITDKIKPEPTTDHSNDPNPPVIWQKHDGDSEELSSPLEKETLPEVPPKGSPVLKPVPDLPDVPHERASNLASSTQRNQEPIVSQPTISAVSGNELSGQVTQQAPNPRLPSFREILAIKSPNERIQAYDRSRAQLIETDSGLNSWLKATVAAKPDLGNLASQPPGPKQPSMASNLPPQRPGSGLTRMQSLTGFSNSANASSQGGAGARLSSQQVQAKGKDLLHSAGVIGGKASTISKGLFAKGRSRFKGGSSEKVEN